MAKPKNENETLAVWEEQIMFWRDHLDIAIEDMFPPIKLTRDQHVIAREFGRCDDIKIVQSRGAGKTWLTALCCFAMAVLYSGTLVAVCSATVEQANLILGKLRLLADQNPNIANEISSSNARSLVQIQKSGAKCTLKNGSEIRSYSLESMRGNRAKIVVVDETPEVDTEQLDAIARPLRNYSRDLSYNYGFKDYKSKIISITSACPKNNPFYSQFVATTKRMCEGVPTAFSCALDYRAAAANGLTDIEFFNEERENMPAITFDMEYGSIFVGVNSNTAFPYELTSAVRTLNTVELVQPKASKSRYTIAIDIATSEAKNADNSVITVLKFTEKADGSYAKKLVYIRSFHGKSLDILAEEVRRLFHLQFPNCERIIYDARGLGDSFDRFFDKDWTDPISGREYPPLVCDDVPLTNHEALQILHPVRAVQSLNQRMYSNTRVALEKKTIELPNNYRTIRQMEATSKSDKKLSQVELAIFAEADALQYEMGCIVAKVGASGNVLYDVPRQSQHKDRYSSLAMNLDYVSELEKKNLRTRGQKTQCVGVVSYF